MIGSNYRIKDLKKDYYNSLFIFCSLIVCGIITYVLDYFGYFSLSFFNKWYSELNLKMFLSENNFISFINWVSLGRILGLAVMVNFLLIFCNELYLIAKIVLLEFISKYMSNNKFIFIISYVIYWFLFFYLIVQFLVFYLINLDNYLLFIGAIFIVPLFQSLANYLKLYFMKKNIDRVNHIFNEIL